MCGLAGIFAYLDTAHPVDCEELLRIRDQMTSRGPDGAGLWLSSNKRIALAHRRLAIIDLTNAGHQPMSTADGRLHISFNGEIYNYLELRAELEQKGCVFQSHSDTEVILHLYRLEGEAMLSRLRGMFAIAIWDEREQSLFLARDHFGIKPLYYADNGKTIRFASQVKALLAGGQIDTTPEPAGLVGFFLWGSVPEPYTSYKNIRALPAGTSLTIDTAGRKKQQPFFNLTEALSQTEINSNKLTADQALEQLHVALLDSVRHHLIADVPVGVFLSAGLDSTTLTALAKEAGVAELRTLTLGFKEFKGTENDETLLAQIVADHYGTNHKTQWIQREDFASHFESLLAAMDQPSIDGVNSYFVCKAAKDAGLKVALSGLGGDELLGGYPSFQEIPKLVNILRPFAVMPQLGTGFRYISAPILKHFTSPKFAGLLEYGTDYAGAYLLRRGLYMPWELPQVLDCDVVREGWRELKALHCLRHTTDGIDNTHLKMSALETTWYMRNQLLRDTDWASMAHSLEVRVPLVDIELFRTVTRLVHAGHSPSKQSMAISPKRRLPETVLNRQKTGFSVPVQEWLADRRNVDSTSQRGLRGWAVIIAGRIITSLITNKHKSGMIPEISKTVASASHAKHRIGLLASEVSTRGGIQSFMLRIAEVICGLVKENLANGGICISLNDSTEALRQHPAMPSVVDVWGGSRSKLNLIAYTLQIKSPIDVLFVGHVSMSPLAFALKVLGKTNAYYVILHGIEAWQRVSFLERRALLAAKGIIATTRYTAEECVKYNNIPADRFHIIPLCADERSVMPSTQFKLNGAFKLLCVARQDASERYKGFEQLFHALVLLKASHPGTHLNLVGNGDDQTRLKEVTHELGIAEQVTFWGALSDEELAAAYAECDVFAMPSKKEGFGIVFLEAMRLGKPCIGGNHGGTPDVIEHGQSGFLVEYEDVPALAESIQTLADDALLRRAMGERGRELVEEKFSFKSFKLSYKQVCLN